MKNKILPLMMLFCFACFGVARAVNMHIGNWESTDFSGQHPLNTVRNYSLTQQIYTHNEIGMQGTITSISFNNTSNSPFSFNNLQVFLKATNKEMFITTSDMVPVSESDKVFEGTFSGSGSGWVTITFDTPFEYDGVSNLLVCFYDPDSGIDPRPLFQTTATSRNLSLAYCDDTAIPDLNNLYEYQGIKFRYKARNNIKLDITPHDNQQLTVYEGTSSSLYVPAYVYYFDEYSRSQFVIPADQLENMNGASINSVKFYTTSSNIPYTAVSSADVYIKEVNYTSISAFEPKASATTVFTGYLDFVSSGNGGEVTINFTNPYQYNGGNLLIGIENTENVGYKSISFYGQNITGASVAGANSTSLENVTPTQRNFIPKTTFSYTNSGTCNAPSYIRTTSLSCDYAHIEWEPVASNGYWMEYKIGDGDWISINNTPIGQGCGLGLYPNSNYSIRVRTECVNGGVSPWTTSHFTSPPVVDPPYNVHLQRLTHNLAYITWDNDETSDLFSGHSFQYKEASSDVWNILCPNNNCGIGSVLSNLTPDTDYNFRVRSNCSNGYQSEWTYFDFTTLAEPVVIPFTEVFGNSNTIQLWKKYSGLMSDVMNGSASLNSGGYWNFSSTSNGVFDTHAVLNIYSTNRKEWMVTPLVEIQNNCLLSFDLALTKYSGTQQPVIPGSQPDDKFAVLVSSNGGVTWNVLREWNNTGSEYVYDDIATTGETVELDLSDYYSPFYNHAYVLVAFYGESTVSNGDNNLHIDNVSIDVKPLCWDLKVHDITLSNITPHSVTVSWTPTGAGVYEVQCCTADDFNTLPLYDIGTIDTSYTFGVDQWNGPLAPETQYYVRVAPDCPEGGYEPWSEVITFTTPEACPLPTNLTITDVTPHGFMATFEPGGDWQTTWHFNTTTTNEPPIYASGTTLAPDITYPEFLHLLETNTHYYLWVGIECEEGSGNYIWAEPVDFTTPYSCSTKVYAQDVEIDDVQPHEISLAWDDSHGSADQWQVYYSYYDYAPGNNPNADNIVTTNTNYATIDGLASDLEYHFWIRALCEVWEGTPEWGEWSDMITASTEVSCYPPVNITVSNITSTSATISWEPNPSITVPVEYYEVNIESDDWGDPYVAFVEGTSFTLELDEGWLDEGVEDLPCTVYVHAYCGQMEGLSVASETVGFILTDKDQLTVYDGEDVNNNVPIYGLWVDQFSKSQFIIPSEDIEDMQYSEISWMTFYAVNDYIDWGNAKFQVYLMELPCETEFTSATLFDWDDMELVRSEGRLGIRDGQMVVDFEEPFFYTDGNLVIGFEEVVTGSYKSCSWYGVNQTGNTAIGGYEYAKDIALQKFLPKTSFIYEPTGNTVCRRPKDFTIERVDPNTIAASWTPGSEDQTLWHVAWGGEDFDPEDPGTYINNSITPYNPCWIGDFEPGTYYFSLRAVCNQGQGVYSSWTCPVSFTLEACPTPADVTITDITATQATVNWVGEGDTWITLYRADYDETYDFETNTLEGWTSEGDGTWTVGTGDGNTNNPIGSHTSNYNANIIHTSTNNETWLISPMLDMTGMHNAYVDFWYVNRDWSGDIDELGVYYRIDGGEWNLIWSTNEAHETWTNEQAHIFYFGANLQIGFKMTDHYGYGVGLDDIEIAGYESAGGFWRYYPDQSITFENLEPNNKYMFMMIANCDGEDSDGTGCMYFTTEEVTTVTQTIALSAGWNWVSSYVEITLDDLKAALLEAYPGAAINQLVIKGNGVGQTAWNPTANRWIGQLTTMDLSQMYMVKVPAADEIALEGMLINPADHPVTIKPGVNWIAFPLSQGMSLAEAFAGFSTNQDVVKGNGLGQATWNNNANRWIGQLQDLVPGQGYIYNSKATVNKTLVFPMPAKK